MTGTNDKSIEAQTAVVVADLESALQDDLGTLTEWRLELDRLRENRTRAAQAVIDLELQREDLRVELRDAVASGDDRRIAAANGQVSVLEARYADARRVGAMQLDFANETARIVRLEEAISLQMRNLLNARRRVEGARILNMLREAAAEYTAHKEITQSVVTVISSRHRINLQLRAEPDFQCNLFRDVHPVRGFVEALEQANMGWFTDEKSEVSIS